jgi:uncharacterized protein YgiM (DUF1202 family)
MKRLISCILLLALLSSSGVAMAHYANPKNANVNVRKGPGFNYKVIGHLLKNTYVEIVANHGAWAEIKYEGKTAYVNNAYLSSHRVSGGTSYPTLRRGSKGESVEILQKELGITVDGKFGQETQEAVEKFQDKNNLDVDGVVGRKTWTKLRED